MVSGAAKVLAASFLHPDNGPSFTVRGEQQSTTTTTTTSTATTTVLSVPQSNQQTSTTPQHHWETELAAKRERMTRMGFPEEMIAQALKSEETKLAQMTAKMTSAAASTSTPAVAVGDTTTTTTTIEPVPRQKDRPIKQGDSSSPATGSTGAMTALQTLRSSIEDKRTRMKKMGFPDEVIITALKNDEDKLSKMMNE